MPLLGLSLAILIGISLGLLGGGGSILAVPILVYVVGMAAKPAIAVSLLVVGTTSFVGALRHWRAANLEPGTAAVFGLVSMAGAYAGGRMAVGVPDSLQLLLFASVMLTVSVSMFRTGMTGAGGGTVRMPLVAASAAGVGVLTGVVGVGGGFLIVPALVLFAGMEMRRAVGTSLLVIAMNSMAGFAAYAGTVPIDWTFTAIFTLLATCGVFLGARLVPSVPQRVLRRAFAAFLIVVGSAVLLQNALTW